MKHLTVGKSIGRFIYFHRSAITYYEYGDEVRRLLSNITPSHSWNVLKADKLNFTRFSLLLYSNFIKNPFPELRLASTYNSGRGITVRNYHNSKNPYILHRKELLLHHTNKYVPGWSKTTKHLAEIGALDTPKLIGTKIKWQNILETKRHLITNEDIIKYLDSPSHVSD